MRCEDYGKKHFFDFLNVICKIDDQGITANQLEILDSIKNLKED
jgi:hypothetical protein